MRPRGQTRAASRSPPWVLRQRRALLVDSGEVARRGGDVLVTEELLQAGKRPAASEVAKREAVPECMRVCEPPARPRRRRARSR
jgi:hypothetical protein